jgi:hypothetical protein
LERLPAQWLDVAAPATRVRGTPGSLALQPRACPLRPTAETRRRIVDIAIQEWGFFGFRVAGADETGEGQALPAAGEADDRDGPRRRPRLSPEEAARVAGSIAGYWAVTTEGAWIVSRQNERWNGPDGIGARWNAPWSAAFISWVMCEAGLGTAAQFRRAIAHHHYIDQAIRARDGAAPEAAFAAYDPGEEGVSPGDLLCASRRPAYRTLADRRRQMGAGARSHCDVVVSVDAAQGRVLAIGGNVRGAVSLKALPAIFEPNGRIRVSTGNLERPLFAHLKLRAAAIGPLAIDASPTMRAAPRAMPQGAGAGTVRRMGTR